MSATAAATDIGFGTILSKKTGPTTFVPFAEVTDITLPEWGRDSVDFTHMLSPNRIREFKPGLKDPGEVGIVYNLIPGVADDATIATHMASNLVEGWRITFPNGATFDFNGFATKHGRATPMSGKMTGSATFKISGAVTLTPAA